MSDTEKSQSPKKASASTDTSAKGSNDTLQAAFDKANDQGFFGEVPDETPNEAYTVAGVTKAAKERKR